MSISFPIYKRGNNYVLHLRIAGRQIKRTLATCDPAIARVRAVQLLSELLSDTLPKAAHNNAPNFELMPPVRQHNIPFVQPIEAQALHRHSEAMPTVF